MNSNKEAKSLIFTRGSEVSQGKRLTSKSTKLAAEGTPALLDSAQVVVPCRSCTRVACTMTRSC